MGNKSRQGYKAEKELARIKRAASYKKDPFQGISFESTQLPVQLTLTAGVVLSPSGEVFSVHIKQCTLLVHPVVPIEARAVLTKHEGQVTADILKTALANYIADAQQKQGSKLILPGQATPVTE